MSMQDTYTMPDLKLIAQTKQLLEEHYKTERNSAFYADKLNISLYRLNAVLKSHLGKTVYELIQERIHHEAEHLLKFSSLSAKQIANELGVSDPPYFNRCFKRITGMPPREFRRKFYEGLVTSVAGFSLSLFML